MVWCGVCVVVVCVIDSNCFGLLLWCVALCCCVVLYCVEVRCVLFCFRLVLCLLFVV